MRRLRIQASNDREVFSLKLLGPVTQETGGTLAIFIDMGEGRKIEKKAGRKEGKKENSLRTHQVKALYQAFVIISANLLNAIYIFIIQSQFCRLANSYSKGLGNFSKDAIVKSRHRI